MALCFFARDFDCKLISPEDVSVQKEVSFAGGCTFSFIALRVYWN